MALSAKVTYCDLRIPINIIVPFSSEFRRLQRINGCGINLIIENGEHLLAHLFFDSLIAELTSPSNRIFQLTIKNRRYYDIDWMMYREVAHHNIVPRMHMLASQIASDSNSLLKRLNIQELENGIHTAPILIDALRLMILNGSSVETFKLHKAHLGFIDDISNVFAEAIYGGSLKTLSLSMVQGMSYTMDFGKPLRKILPLSRSQMMIL